MTQTWTHAEYTAHEIIMNRWRAPKVMIEVRFPPTGDIYKSRACAILEQFKPYYSHRLGYVVSPKKFLKFAAEMDKPTING